MSSTAPRDTKSHLEALQATRHSPDTQIITSKVTQWATTSEQLGRLPRQEQCYRMLPPSYLSAYPEVVRMRTVAEADGHGHELCAERGFILVHHGML